jgi:hypothetical protein
MSPEFEIRRGLTLEAELAKAPKPLSSEERRLMINSLREFGRFFDELRLIADAPAGDPRIFPDFEAAERGSSALFPKPLALSVQECDAEGGVVDYNLHLRLGNIVGIIDEHDYPEALMAILHQSISLLFELECQFYRDVPGAKREIVEKYQSIFGFDAMNYQNVCCLGELTDKLRAVYEDAGLERLDLAWAWRYYRPEASDEKVAHIRTLLCDCGGAVTLAGPSEPGSPAVLCPLCQKVLARQETVH